VVVDAAPGEGATVSLYPLTNGQTYYIAVRAIDAGGLEGPMSEVVEAVPVESFGAAALAGEDGGCASAAGPRAGWLVALGGVGLLVARRRRLVAAVALGVGVGAGGMAEAAPKAAAGASGAPVGLVDPADRHGTVALRLGRLDVQDPNINKVAEQAGKEVLWLDVGPRITRYGELTAGLGWFQELGYLVDENGAPTADRQMLTALPMSLNAGLRLDFVDEQPIVPFGGAGLDMWAWRENWQGPGDTKMSQRIGGWKTGWHWQVGGAFLLDRLDRSRASRLQARSGIDDTWATVEYREQEVGAEGLVFSGSWVGFGLRVDY
jgi:MYXO-CTERM domain-containing protein